MTFSGPAEAEQSASNELLPCPFCGASAEMIDLFHGNRVVICSECSAEVDKVGDWTRRVDKKAAGFDYILKVLKSHHMTKPGISTLVQKAEKMVAW